MWVGGFRAQSEPINQVVKEFNFQFCILRSFPVRTPVRNSDSLSVFPGCGYNLEQPTANEM
jgi:hypothetical protein